MVNKYRIVIVRSNPVEPDSRVEKEANSLVKAGFQVMLVVWDREKNYFVKTDNKLLENCEVKRVRFGAKASYGDGMKCFFPFVKFQVSLLIWLIVNRKKYDIGHFCDFDTAYTGSLACNLLRKKYVFDIFDYLSTDARKGMRLLVKRKEDKIINRSDATVICTEKRRLQIKDAMPHRIVVVHNSPERISLTEISKKTSGNRIKIAYIGILQEHRLLKEMIDTVSEMTEVELHIGGFGKLEPFIIEAAKKNENIFFYGRLPYNETIALEKECDIMTAIYDPAIGNHRFAAPNKFYESLMLGKPVIMVRGTGMSEVVEQKKIGELIEFSKEGFRLGLQRIIGRKDEWSALHDIMVGLYEKNYSWTVMEKRLVALYNSL